MKKIIENYLNKLQETISAGAINPGFEAPHLKTSEDDSPHINLNKKKKKLNKIFLQHELKNCKNK